MYCSGNIILTQHSTTKEQQPFICLEFIKFQFHGEFVSMLMFLGDIYVSLVQTNLHTCFSIYGSLPVSFDVECGIYRRNAVLWKVLFVALYVESLCASSINMDVQVRRHSEVV